MSPGSLLFEASDWYISSHTYFRGRRLCDDHSDLSPR